MLHFADKPYRFVPPRPSRLVQVLAAQVNRHYLLPCQSKIHRVETACPEAVKRVWRQGGRLLFVPNHPSHNDPPVMFEAFRRFRIRSMFMAAYEVFVAEKWRSWLMRRCGVFSVDREASDKQAVKQAVQTLVEGRYALTIFAEGNVYLQNDRVTPFLEGAFFIASKALRELQSKGESADVWVCPVSLKFTHLQDVRPQIIDRLHQAAEAVGTSFDESRPHVAEIRRIGAVALRRNLQQRGIPFCADEQVSLPEQIKRSAEAFVEALEQKVGLAPRPKDSLKERVRRIRRTVHEVRTDPSREADHEVATSWAIEAMTALRILSYSGRYLDHPTLDRVAETTEKLLEDIFSRMGAPYSPRCAYARVAEPISVSAVLEKAGGKPREAIQELARRCEAAVQEGLDLINQSNPHPGAQLY